MRKKNRGFRWFMTALFAFAANSGLLTLTDKRWIFVSLTAFLSVNILAGAMSFFAGKKWLKILAHGGECLFIFCISLVLSILYHLLIPVVMPLMLPFMWISILVCYFAHLILFWNGIICVYLKSYQLGIKHRVIGAICGPIPIVNLFALRGMLKVILKEIEFETEKERVNRKRKKEEVCKTKYPLLFVHGVFFRDSKLLNYWGRIPEELEINGATVFYGNHQSALSVADSAKELSLRIKEIIRETGCEKVNVIAHSKGGLDTRYAIAHLGISPYVASLTTVNTPHRGCNFADDLLSKIPKGIQEKVASAYNRAARTLGDTDPDFMAAVKDLTASACKDLNEGMSEPEGIFCQSLGSVLKGAGGGKFPLNFTHPMVKKHDGENDGLVSVDSFEFGECYRLLSPMGKRGISHGDMIDLNRENIEDFDVRELYVELVSDLKNRGF